MPVCPRCALVGLALFALALVGCDSSNPGRDLDAVDGVYTLETLTFDPVTQGLPTADVGARLDQTTTGTTLEVFGGDGEAVLRIRQLGGTGAQRVVFDAAASRGRLSLAAEDEEDEEDLASVLLPPEFALSYDGDSPRVLEGSFDLSGVNLEAFDSSVYQDQRSNRGTLTVRFRRP